MQDSCVEGVANHNGPESCGAAREGGAEALTGESAGRVLSREIHALPRARQVLRDADALGESGRQHGARRFRQERTDPARSETSCMYGNTLRGNREVPLSSAAERAADRIGKSKDVSR